MLKFFYPFLVPLFLFHGRIREEVWGVGVPIDDDFWTMASNNHHRHEITVSNGVFYH